MVVDISFIVFTFYYIWRLRTLNKKIENYTQETRLSVESRFKETELIIYKCVKNPRLARTLLKEKQE
tara:strand:+ start:1547 stop:1747 length:201 start_codon:yes stop_codon:yes gene_type:complete